MFTEESLGSWNTYSTVATGIQPTGASIPTGPQATAKTPAEVPLLPVTYAQVTSSKRGLPIAGLP